MQEAAVRRSRGCDYYRDLHVSTIIRVKYIPTKTFEETATLI